VSEPHMIADTVQMGNDTDFDKKVLDHQILITIALLQPEARYEIRLNHSAPHAMPLIEVPAGRSDYLSEKDLNTLAWGVKEVRRIAATPPLQDQATGEISPGHHIVSGSRGLLKWIRANVRHNSHWVGSARMGPTAARDMDRPLKPRQPMRAKSHTSSGGGGPEERGESEAGKMAEDNRSAEWRERIESESVLDPSFSVRGVKNLRVVDASVFPVIPNGNVHSSVVMMASRAADILIAEYKRENHKTSKR
ncbi:betA, partial [Symbiodinium microadriaticum]